VRQTAVLFLCGALLAEDKPKHLTPQMREVSKSVTASALRGHVAFLSSDLLEGRDTPSRGLEIAGEYLAAQLRLIGLEPVGDVLDSKEGYFQNVVVQPENPNSARSRNVAGILRGSDPVLQNSYVILSSHYDHIGLAKTGADLIFNGANDDASGTASVLEAARALAALKFHPKRSILIILFCCEEKGLRGSRYYALHPLVPLAKTVAHLNLEQMGRTDSTEGPHVKAANLTGFDFSDLTQTVVAAGQRVGIQVTKDPKGSDSYFNRSDNGPLARLGIPAHTMSVTYDFPDYHAVGDEWQKIDYDNMAQVDRAVAISVLELATSTTAPKWNVNYAPAKQYVDAGKKLYGD
jgi:Zn-dependent M28 family amino/carboxypeptidase